MPADLTALVPEFRLKVEQLVAACRDRGITMRPYMGLRTPAEQGKLWRQSRSREVIEQRIQELRQAGAPFLADCIESVGPQNGRPVTNAIPGLSWHQWGEAVDSFWLVGTDAEWSTERLVNGLNGYHVYADEAERLGIHAGGHWASFKDWPHVQLRAAASPRETLSLAQIDAEMQRRFAR